MTKLKNVNAYSPSESDFKHMRHCHSKGLITLGLSGIYERPNVFHLAKTDLNVSPITQDYFLKDFSKPPTPANRQEFTEKEAYVKMFAIYKEFYMRNLNIKEAVIAEVIKEDAKKPEPKKEKKVPKQKAVPKDMINFPFKQIDLLEMIELCEEDNKNAKGNEPNQSGDFRTD